MSTEQEKESLCLKRTRGGDGGLDVLGGPGLLVGTPDKKRRKSSTQAPSFSPLSEYAPPANTSSDHLIAANPFDDSYSLTSTKPLTSANPYFDHSHHPWLSGYGPSRMAPHMGNRMPSPYGPSYQMRNQPHPFSQNPMGMGFNRAPGFNYGHPENPGYGQLFGSSHNNMNLHPMHHFRSAPGEHVHKMPLHLNQSCSPDGGPGFSPEGVMCVNPVSAKTASGTSPKLSQPQNNFTQSGTPTPKPDLSETLNKNLSPRKQQSNCKDNTTQDSAGELKSKGRGNTSAALDGGAEKLNGVLLSSSEPSKKSPRPVPENAPADKVLRSNSRVPAHANRRSTSSSCEPVYPCGICLSEVNDDQEAILCEASCQKWFHRVCTGMTETAYNLLTAETSAVWGCDTCMEDKGAQLLKTRAETPVTSEPQS